MTPRFTLGRFLIVYAVIVANAVGVSYLVDALAVRYDTWLLVLVTVADLVVVIPLVLWVGHIVGRRDARKAS